MVFIKFKALKNSHYWVRSCFNTSSVFGTSFSMSTELYVTIAICIYVCSNEAKAKQLTNSWSWNFKFKHLVRKLRYALELFICEFPEEKMSYLYSRSHNEHRSWPSEPGTCIYQYVHIHMYLHYTDRDFVHIWLMRPM